MKVIEFVNWFLSIFGIYILWILLHYYASQMYVTYCVPTGFYGFLITPILVQSPHCCIFRWMINNGAYTINNIWGFIGGFIMRILTV